MEKITLPSNNIYYRVTAEEKEELEESALPETFSNFLKQRRICIIPALKPREVTNCWFCRGEMRWNSDFNYDEVHGEGEGIVSMLTCSHCGAEAEFSIRTDVVEGE